jgi:putative ABC transport system permease protein
MIKNYFKIAWRNLVKNKTFSIINVFGLSVGLTCFMLIAAFVYNELSYDRYAAQADHIYRVELNVDANGGTASYPMVDGAVGRGIQQVFPEVLAFTRYQNGGRLFARYKDKQFKEEKVAFLDSNFLETFSIPLLEGDQKNALVAPNSMVISKAAALKYFDKEPALGKTIAFANENYTVTGVFDKVPDNSHFHFDMAMSPSTQQRNRPETWSNVSHFTYLVLKPGADITKLEAKLPQLVAKYVVPEIQHDMGVSLAEAQKSVNTFRFTLQPLTDIHLHANTQYELEPNGDINYLYIFSALALFILLLACVNFTNLSTASAGKRSKEVGIRKVMGSLKTQLIIQFLTESILLSLAATLIALAIVYALLPAFNQLAGKNIAMSFFLQPISLMVALGMSLLTGILAGIYPSFVLSAFIPIKVLKGTRTAHSRRSLLRNSLVVFQFVISTALIIATLVVYRQLHFMQNIKLGYNKEQVLIINDTYALGNNEQAFKQKLLQDSRVVNAAISWSAPATGRMDGTQIYVRPENTNDPRNEIQTGIYRIDYNFLGTLGMQIASGRNFSPEYPSDSSAVLINETAVRELGIKGNPLGRTIVRSGRREFTIVGVVKDFHFTSAKQKISPLIMLMGRNEGAVITKIKTTQVAQLVADIKKDWEAFGPNAPFSYTFLDQRFASLYAAEEKSGELFTLFAIISIVIACLGLFGLVAYTIEQRTKEIGIRKVLGASVQQVLLMVSKEFLYLVLIAFVIAIPTTWWAMSKWLEDFAYRTSINVWTFGMAGIIALFIAVFTISFQAIKAALMNPVKSLRSE